MVERLHRVRWVGKFCSDYRCVRIVKIHVAGVVLVDLKMDQKEHQDGEEAA